MSKDFLNTGIIGDKGGIAAKRGFRKIKTDAIEKPRYDSEFFEAFPTMWANAYAFQRSLEQEAKQKTNNEQLSAQRNLSQREVTDIEEWIVLLSLHYLGVVYLENFSSEILKGRDYDWDLWKALSITYPFNTLSEIELVMLDKSVIGAYYPSIVFFPVRERSGWVESEGLKPYLSGKKLSWEKFYQLHLKDDESSRLRLHEHLRSIPQVLDGTELKKILMEFCQRQFGDFDGEIKDLSTHPRGWDTYGNKLPSSDTLLEAYPLKKVDEETNITTYYLLTDMPNNTGWMNLKLGNGLPAPTAYTKSQTNNEILVNFAGNTIKCEISEYDEIKFLKDFFLPYPPFWCKVTEENFVAKVRSFNQVAINSPDRDKDDKAYCLLPVKSDFLKEFPEIFDEKNVRRIKAEPLADEVIQWRIPVCGYDIEFEAAPEINSNMKKATVAIYPPQVSPKWKIYAAYGSVVENTGSWQLIDEQGQKGNTFIQLKNDEYVSVCHDEGNKPNRPRALLFLDGNNNESGVLFLQEKELKNVSAERTEPAKLAVDFGTSNTCLAYSIGGKKGEVLRFSLSPLLVWGEPTDADAPGFAPKRWGGERGFFPTVLFSRRKFQDLWRTEPSQLKIANLFQVDLPSLHKGIESAVISDTFGDAYEVHFDLKWGRKSSEPWRSLFLRAVLFYAHAELFFLKQVVPNEYVFTYPLAFNREDLDSYEESSRTAAIWVREHCYEASLKSLKTDFYKLDESTAIAKSIQQEGQKGLLEVFIDIGGGTADIAIRYGDQFILLDSLRLAGEAFFDFTEKNFSKPDLPGANNLRRHLGVLLLDIDAELPINRFGEKFKTNLGVSYSYLISLVPEPDFIARESKVLPKTNNPKKDGEEISYQRYRSKLFFKHIFLYALTQACALVASSEEVSSEQGIRFILGGNGWGLLLFAGWQRSESYLELQAKQLLELLKEKLVLIATEDEFKRIEQMQITDVDLLNHKNLSEVKTSVALGALEAKKGVSSNLGEAAPFTGISVRHLKVNKYEKETIRWCERWNMATLLEKLKDADGKKAIFDAITSAESAAPLHPKKPLDEILSVFTAIGNESNLREDNMPPNEWTKMNGALNESIKEMQVNNQRLTDAPINEFLTKVLYPMRNYDYLDILAEINGITKK